MDPRGRISTDMNDVSCLSSQEDVSVWGIMHKEADRNFSEKLSHDSLPQDDAREIATRRRITFSGLLSLCVVSPKRVISASEVLKAGDKERKSVRKREDTLNSL